jgi:hypothetical protein
MGSASLQHRLASEVEIDVISFDYSAYRKTDITKAPVVCKFPDLGEMGITHLEHNTQFFRKQRINYHGRSPHVS